MFPLAMDELQNAINEGRKSGEGGENVWLPSAPQPSPEKILEDAPVQSPRGDQTTPHSPEQESVAEKIVISRFTVTKTPTNSPTDTKETTSHIPLNADDQEAS